MPDEERRNATLVCMTRGYIKEAVREEAHRTRMSVSALLEQIIEYYLAAQERAVDPD